MHAPPSGRLGDTTPMVEVAGVCKSFGGQPAVRDACFSLQQGHFLTILGPSGCGKTTLLRMVAGFIAPDAGRISIHGAPAENVPAHRRAIGMVFQRLALFPHLTARENVAYPLKMRRFAARRIPARVDEYLDLARLGGLGDRRIHELSGGQQQRVAIARALVFGPDLLLLDEPLSALDRKLREEMQLEFRRIQRQLGVTTINVTHDQREALVMSDDVVVMRDGTIEQNATPTHLYREPANRFVAGFIGLTTFLRGEVAAREGQWLDVAIGGMTLRTRAASTELLAGVQLECALRAEQVAVVETGTATGYDNRVEGEVRERVFEGDRMLYEVHCAALADTMVYVFDHDPLHRRVYAPGDRVVLGWNAGDLLAFAADEAPARPIADQSPAAGGQGTRRPT